MPPGNTTVDTMTEPQVRATLPSPHVPAQPAIVPIDPLPDRHWGSREGMRRIDDLAPAKGIMLSLLLGMTLWGCIVAFCLR
jgi:hypothetical protein